MRNLESKRISTDISIPTNRTLKSLPLSNHLILASYSKQNLELQKTRTKMRKLISANNRKFVLPAPNTTKLNVISAPRTLSFKKINQQEIWQSNLL